MLRDHFISDSNAFFLQHKENSFLASSSPRPIAGRSHSHASAAADTTFQNTMATKEVGRERREGLGREGGRRTLSRSLPPSFSSSAEDKTDRVNYAKFPTRGEDVVEWEIALFQAALLLASDRV